MKHVRAIMMSSENGAVLSANPDESIYTLLFTSTVACFVQKG